MDDRFSQQLKKGVLEMMVLKLICRKPSYGYELLSRLKEDSTGMFSLKEGTLYPILYRLEDDGMIASSWTVGEGKLAPKKMYTATQKGLDENQRRHNHWVEFVSAVNAMIAEEDHHDGC